MEVNLALLCDRANLSVDHKLNLLGVFDQVDAKSFPVTMPEMTLVVRFQGTVDEIHEGQEIEIEFVGATGEQLGQINAAIPMPAPPLRQTGSPLSLIQVLGLSNVRFDTPGEHAFRIMVAGKEKARVPVRVISENSE